MPEVIDLAAHKAAMDAEQTEPAPVAFEDLTPEEQAALREAAAKAGVEATDGPERVLPVTTAFLVFVTPEGAVQCHHDITLKLEPSRNASLDDMYGAMSAVLADINSQRQAGAIVQAQMMVQQQMAQQAEAARIANAVKQNPYPNGPRKRR